VLIVAPHFQDGPAEEDGVVRVPAIQNFNGSDFSVRLPIPGYLRTTLREFGPELVHAHHPFLLGDTALRAAAQYDVPLVFQHHTMYERYTHYVPGDSPALKQFAIDLSTEYANLCDHVFAPSESVCAVLRDRGVETPVEVVPTGVDVSRFAHGHGRRMRRELGIPDGATVVGHLGRLAPEKNLRFLAEAVAQFLRRQRGAYFLVVGEGPSQDELRRIFDRLRIGDRLVLAGAFQGQDVVDAFHAMNVFAFASKSETQGMVLTEAMAAGCPVVGLDAPGVREVVEDGSNGRLLPAQQVDRFVAALAWMAGREASEYDGLCQAARETAARFSMCNCAEKALGIYQSLVESCAGGKVGKGDWETAWQPLLRRAETEWELFSRRAQAVGKAAFGLGPLLRWLAQLYGRTRRALCRSEWLARLFGLDMSSGSAGEPGVILIQIDGLSRDQFERALAKGRLPFLRRLLRREHYKVHTLYSGLPSTTPAVQGELFYGVNGAVPAFCFRDSETGEVARMYDPDASAKIQRRLALQGRGLLEDGTAYADIFSGGAAESQYCPATTGWDEAVRMLNPFAVAATFILHFWSAVRVVALLGVEVFLALSDFARGAIAGRDLLKELKFVPTRLGVCVLLRELVTGGACIDATRGLPIVHLTLLGYDEQAHRRGPSSAFAHWSLKGIDDAVRRIWSVAHRSERRDYQVWVYSDHGQEEVVPFTELTGRSIHDVVSEIVSHGEESSTREEDAGGIQYCRSTWLGSRWWEAIFRHRGEGKETHSDEVLVTAMGPLGHVYPPESLSAQERDRLARLLVGRGNVPLVLTADEQGSAWAWNVHGKFRLPDEARDIIGPSHPLPAAVAEDLTRLCHHVDAGELVISGWQSDGQPVSFSQERGAHGGPGREETRAFALLPADVPLESASHGVARPSDLRHAAMDVLGHRIRKPRSPARPAVRANILRVLTYNVHSCIGTDGKLSPKRIARVIAQCEPDVVALQELDVGRRRTEYVHQADVIAAELQMAHHFHPAYQVESEQYGNAVLSRFPLRMVRAARLPGPDQNGNREPRSALWVCVDVNGQPWQLLNVHLGLSARERESQVETLLGDQWICDPRFRERQLLCGDLNTVPGSRAHRLLSAGLRDAQRRLSIRRLPRTFPSQFPLLRLDHVFVGPEVEVVRAEVRSSQLARVASDHLPLLVEVRITGNP
jgi:endonuclease/exonuclease/phosphatase family metal-dependent hydrolase/glycosyltransferase involved in cell wall biosynthesis